MGRVYCAEQVALERTVAVKVVHPDLAGDEVTAARFLNEARAASRLSHPNSVAIFDFGRTADGQPYIVMEYLRGRDLERVAQAEGPLPLRRVVHIMQQALAALGEAHALGIVHRDVKPDNIVVETLRSGLDFVKVVDFGLAKLLTENALGASHSRPGIVCGTPEYMSPEQGRGDALDGRSDLYSAGVVLFELLTGRVPFAADTQTKTLSLQLTEPPPDPRHLAPERGIPRAFAELTLRALSKSREDRPQDAAAFADALDRALMESEGRSPDPPPVTAIRCGSCGRLTPIGQRFCGECGSPIALRSPSPAAGQELRRPAHAARWSSVFPSAPAETAAVQTSSPPTLIARQDAIDWLEGRRREAASMPAAAHVIGEPGMGKTRLLSEVLDRWSSRGDHVVRVGPDPSWAKVADVAVRHAIRSLALPSGDPEGARETVTRETRMGLQTLFGPSPPTLLPEQRRAAVAEALRWSLQCAEARAGAGRVVLAIDDLDFLDGTSRLAFADVLAEPAAVPVLVVASYGPGTRPVTDPAADEVWRLGPLPYESFARLVPARVLMHGVPLAPLHMEQLMAWAEETTEPPPEQLGLLIARRTERLGLQARQTLHALAVWGDDATLGRLTKMIPTAVDLVSGIDALERARIVTVDGVGIRISHPLVRRVIFSSIPVGRKRELFARCAEMRPDAPLEIRARDAMHGGSAFEALALLDALGARRAAHGDVSGSVSALRHGLELARRELHRGELDDPSTAVIVFSRKLAEALVVAHRWTDADGVLREALGGAPPNSEQRAHLLGVMAHVANARRHPGEARRYLDEAIRVARQSDARELMPLLERLDKTIAVA